MKSGIKPDLCHFNLVLFVYIQYSDYECKFTEKLSNIDVFITRC